MGHISHIHKRRVAQMITQNPIHSIEFNGKVKPHPGLDTVYLANKFMPNAFNQLGKTRIMRWRNVVLSMIHSMSCSDVPGFPVSYTSVGHYRKSTTKLHNSADNNLNFTIPKINTDTFSLECCYVDCIFFTNVIIGWTGGIKVDYVFIIKAQNSFRSDMLSDQGLHWRAAVP